MKITILIPCYNGSKFLNRCLDSCIKQTYKDTNILIVNDGSIDNSQEIIESYIKIYPNIKLINQSNKGLATTRNVLLKNMETQYGFFLDVDDWIDNDCIEFFVNNYNHSDLVINSAFINKKNSVKPFYITNKINKDTNNEKYLINNTPFAWGILFNKDVFKNNTYFCEISQFFEDAGVVSYLIYKTKNISFINDPKYHYFINQESLSRENKMNFKKINDALMQLNNFYQLIKKEGFERLPQCLNDQLAFYHCIIFTYIQFQSNIDKFQKKELKDYLKLLEAQNFKLKTPKRYWKKWYFYLYRVFNY